MNIDQYINWGDIWSKEICLQTSIYYLQNIPNDLETISVINQFSEDTRVELIASECYINEGVLIFCFGETGGQNESDTQGWSRDYTFIVDSSFLIIGAEYSQG